MGKDARPNRLKWRIRVKAINSGDHPEFARHADHPYAAMVPERRVDEIDSFCGRLWARTCDEEARSGKLKRPRKKAA